MNRTELKNWIEENLDWYEMSHNYSEPNYSLDEGKDLIFFADMKFDLYFRPIETE